MSVFGFTLPEEITAAADGVEAFVRAEVLSRHEKHADLLDNPRKLYDEDGRYSRFAQEQMRAVRMASAKAGFYNISVPTSIGGAGMGLLAYYATIERIYHVCGAQHWLCDYVISHWAFGPSPVLGQVTPETRESILPGMLEGATSMCFGMSEPGAGSDAAMLRTRAVPDGIGWRISGRKIWTSNSPYADYIIVFAITDAERAAAKKGGISAFLVPTGSAGFQIDRIIRMHGHIGGNEAECVFDEVRVEPHQIVGTLHEGFRVGLFGVSMGRIYNSARAVGIARWAIEKAVQHASTREAFGSKIADFQGVSFPLAHAATEIHAAHLLGVNAAMLLDRGERAVKELSMAKAYSVQAAVRAVDAAMQTHGAMGFTNEIGLVEAYERVRRANVADGTNEILARTISQRLFKGDLEL